ncbi:hypothetical protein E1A91_D11G184300v1 [Gossypium mustelinum]|uniref:Thaumatin-like protein 1 n=1 Tax=Gossypium mustelinum TaxID=34275 RepID=A0A5D2SVQ5_GOSMU|nr:hypothetical protein E1A91_D11G184300v1 [Gossypium mustelinum]
MITLAGGSQSFPTTGFSLNPGESTSISIPRSWTGRIWGRTLCTQDSSGNFSCLTGDCGTSRPECSGSSSIQATLAEFGFNDLGDFYDVSLVGGYNLPLMISPHGGTGGDCNSTGCVADLNGDCPSELKVVNGSETVACKSACSALGEPQYCCSGEYYSPATCQPTSYSQFFKTACPTAYSYAFDDDATVPINCTRSAAMQCLNVGISPLDILSPEVIEIQNVDILVWSFTVKFLLILLRLKLLV